MNAMMVLICLPGWKRRIGSRPLACGYFIPILTCWVVADIATSKVASICANPLWHRPILFRLSERLIPLRRAYCMGHAERRASR